MDLREIESLAAKDGLCVFGALHPEASEHLPDWCQTLVLLGPAPEFWAGFITSPEWLDHKPDPMDRWSERVIGDLAESLKGQAVFPFGGPPFLPFFTWALQSGAAWQSPVNLLVHAKAGLMVSYRGAICLREDLELPDPAISPCEACHQPCLGACAPRALTAEGYDVARCKATLNAEKHHENKLLGCSVRRACPVSQSYARMEAQSAYHMRIFLGEDR